MIIESKAFARAGILGNPSDGYFGKTISLIVRNFGAHISLYPTPELHIEMQEQDSSTFRNIYHLKDAVSLVGYNGGLPLIKAAIKKFCEHCDSYNIRLSNKNFTIRYNEQYRCSVIATESVPRDKVSRYGIVGGKVLSDNIMELDQLIEKPSVEKAPSNLAIAGRYILTPQIYKALEKTVKGKNNELQLTDALVNLLKSENIYSCAIEGKRYDIGNKLDFLKTTVDFALKRKEFAEPFFKYLKAKVEELEALKVK